MYLPRQSTRRCSALGLCGHYASSRDKAKSIRQVKSGKGYLVRAGPLQWVYSYLHLVYTIREGGHVLIAPRTLVTQVR
jgi:hypothetical protein